MRSEEAKHSLQTAELRPRRTSGGRKVLIQPKAADELERKSWADIGRKFRETRFQKGLTLEEVAERIRVQNANYIITPSQISRIETGRRDPGFFNTKVIAKALDINLDEFAGDRAVYGYYLFSPETMHELLEEHLQGRIDTARHDGRHQLLIKEKVYRPIPLERGRATSHNDAILENSMSINLLRVEHASQAQMMRPKALDSHDGEEVIFVIDGELEFFFVEKPYLDPSKPPEVTQKRVHAGGCLHYAASGLHGFRAIGAGPALALYVASKPRAYVVETSKKEQASDRRRQK